MKKLGAVLLLLLLLLTGAVAGALAPPHSLSLQTLNTQYILLWEWEPDGDEDQFWNQSVSFTSQYIAEFRTRRGPRQNWISVCENTVERRCDFTNERLLYQGIYLLRVRANAPSDVLRNTSSWRQIRFCPDKHATLGPPSIRLHSSEGNLELFITDPQTSDNQSMRTVVEELYYQIQRWRCSREDPVVVTQTSQKNQVILSGLEPRSCYCVRVQSRFDFENKSSVFSDERCDHTLDDPMGLLRWFSLSFVCFMLVFGSFVLFRTAKSIFQPHMHLPDHFEELWQCEPGSPQLFSPGSLQSVCEPLTVVSAEQKWSSQFLDPDSDQSQDLDRVWEQYPNQDLDHFLNDSTSNNVKDGWITESQKQESQTNSGDSGMYSTEDEPPQAQRL